LGNPIVWTIIGILLTIATLVGNVVYRSGHLSARVESLEEWRINVRQDMHEISEKLEENNKLIHQVIVLVEERTERRLHMREHKRDT
jgi:hypothetical protein